MICSFTTVQPTSLNIISNITQLSVTSRASSLCFDEQGISGVYSRKASWNTNSRVATRFWFHVASSGAVASLFLGQNKMTCWFASLAVWLSVLLQSIQEWQCVPPNVCQLSQWKELNACSTRLWKACAVFKQHLKRSKLVQIGATNGSDYQLVNRSMMDHSPQWWSGKVLQIHCKRTYAMIRLNLKSAHLYDLHTTPPNLKNAHLDDPHNIMN